jgi:hypothetical protein
MTRPLMTLVVLLSFVTPAVGQDPDEVFQRAVEETVEAIRAGAPDGMTVELDPASPRDFGWRSSEGNDLPAFRMVVWAPNGGVRALGFLPLRGVYTARDLDVYRPNLVTVGPEFLVVEGPAPEVAMDWESMATARAQIEEALAPLAEWSAGGPLDLRELPRSWPRFRFVVRFPHYYDGELSRSPDGVLDLSEGWPEGVLAIAYRFIPDGPLPPPTILTRP